MRTRGNEIFARVSRRSGGEGLFRVPGLEELIADPDKVRVLDAHTTRILRMRVIAALNVLSGHEMSLPWRELEGGRRKARGERLLRVKDAAQKFGVNPDWLYRHHKDLPFTVRCGRLLRFSELGIEEFIRGKGG